MSVLKKDNPSFTTHRKINNRSYRTLINTPEGQDPIVQIFREETTYSGTMVEFHRFVSEISYKFSDIVRDFPFFKLADGTEITPLQIAESLKILANALEDKDGNPGELSPEIPADVLTDIPSEEDLLGL